MVRQCRPVLMDSANGEQRQPILKWIIEPMPLIIEVIDEESRLKPLIAQINEVIDDNELITLQEVGVI
jgi:PII-like signaling protein